MDYMRLVPLTTRQANHLVRLWHRHSDTVESLYLFSIGLEDGGKLIGAAIVARPISPSDSDGFTVEVKRLVTNGTKNACSMLYSGCMRAARAMGYCKLITFTLETESGTSLRAAGWKAMRVTNGVTMHTKYGTGERTQEFVRPRIRWEYVIGNAPEPVPYEFEAPTKSKSAPLPFPPMGAERGAAVDPEHGQRTLDAFEGNE